MEPKPATSARPAVYEIQGRQVTLPVEVRDAASGAATFAVDAGAARRLLPTRDLEVPEVWPGRTLLSLAAIDYRDNDLGDYDEVSIALFVRPRGSGPRIPYAGTWIDLLRQRLGTFILRLPVNQLFTCEAGCAIWGFPKSVEEISIDHRGDRTTCRLAMDGRHVLTLGLPRGGSGTMPEREMSTYTVLDGVLHRTRSTMGGDGFRVSGGRGVTLALGDHPLADTLRGLGLPRRAMMSVWTEHMRARFDAAEKL